MTWVCEECGGDEICDCRLVELLEKILDKLTQIAEILERKREEGDF